MPGGVFACVDKVIEVGQDPRRFAEDLLRRLRDLVIVAAVPDALSSGLVEVAPDQAERLRSQAASLGAGELTRAAEVIAVGLTEMRGTTAPRLHLELMCARVLLPGADVDDRGVHARLDRLERRIGVDRAPSPKCTLSLSKGLSPRQRALSLSKGPSQCALSPRRSALSLSKGLSRSSAAEPEPMRPEPVEGREVRASTSPARRACREAKLTVTDVRRLWPEVLEEVKGKRRFTWILLSQNAQVAELRDDTLLLAMANAGARDSFGRGGSEDVLREAIVVVLGADFKIETMVDPGRPLSLTPAYAAPGRAGAGRTGPTRRSRRRGQP